MKRTQKALAFSLVLVLLLACAVPALAAGDAVVNPDSSPGWLMKVLTNEVVRTVLLIIGIAGIVIEFATVGSFGVFGAVGVLAMAGYFMGNVWSGSLTAAAIWLLVGGVVLILVEIFVSPGFGLPGGLGILAVLLSLILASPHPAAAVWEVLIALVVAVVLIWLSFKYRKTRAVWGRFVLSKRTDAESGYNSADPALNRFMEQQGVALTPLHPAGTAEINGERVDVVTRGEFVDAGCAICVVQVEGVRVVVAAAEGPAQ